jgi:hypothetical protein
VEGLVGYARRNFMVPVPHATNWEELNAQLTERCRQRRERKLWGHAETIAERFQRDREKLLPLPAAPYEACEKRPARASSQALVRYETNDYSVPVAYGHQRVLVLVRAPLQTARANHLGMPDASSSLYRQALMTIPSPNTPEQIALRKDMGARECQT